VNVFLLSVLIILSAGVASGVLPFSFAGVAITGLLVGLFSSTDRKPPADVEGRLGWWKRRERGTFYTAWWVLIVLAGVLIRTLFVDGVDWRTALILGIIAIPFWTILRKPPARPWDPGRLTK
jgi:MFS family permease